MRAVLVCARDAGAAVALAPVIALLAERGWRPATAAWGHAAERFEGLPGERFALDAAVDHGVLQGLIRERGIGAVLTGTSMRPDLDGPLWSAPATLGLRPVALLDHWTNYVGRFSVRELFDTVPDTLAVMDRLAHDELVALGFPPTRVAICGQPNLAAITPVTGSEREAARRQLGLDATERTALFASEPKSTRLMAEELVAGQPPYTEVEVLAAVRSALAQHLPGIRLAVRLHPLERDGASVPDGAIDARAGSSRDWIAAADAVIGMTSMLLVEAQRAGVPVLSVRPGGPPLSFLRAHEITEVTDLADLPAKLDSILRPHATAPTGAPHRNAAAENVAALLEERYVEVRPSPR